MHGHCQYGFNIDHHEAKSKKDQGVFKVKSPETTRQVLEKLVSTGNQSIDKWNKVPRGVGVFIYMLQDVRKLGS